MLVAFWRFFFPLLLPINLKSMGGRFLWFKIPSNTDFPKSSTDMFHSISTLIHYKAILHQWLKHSCSLDHITKFTLNICITSKREFQNISILLLYIDYMMHCTSRTVIIIEWIWVTKRDIFFVCEGSTRDRGYTVCLEYYCSKIYSAICVLTFRYTAHWLILYNRDIMQTSSDCYLFYCSYANMATVN